MKENKKSLSFFSKIAVGKRISNKNTSLKKRALV